MGRHGGIFPRSYYLLLRTPNKDFINYLTRMFHLCYTRSMSQSLIPSPQDTARRRKIAAKPAPKFMEKVIEKTVRAANLKKISTDRKALVLSLLGLPGATQETVATQLSMDRSTIRAICREADLSLFAHRENPEIVEKSKAGLRGGFYLAAEIHLRSSLQNADKDPGAAARSMVSAGIATDKARLLDGLSTERFDIRALVVEARADLTSITEQRKQLERDLGMEETAAPILVGASAFGSQRDGKGG